MEIYVTTVYVICDEVLRILEIQDDPQTQGGVAQFPRKKSENHAKVKIET